MKFGLTDSEYKILNDLLIKPLISYRVKLWVFGSRARGDHQKFSDIDVMYELPVNSKLTPEKIAKIKSDLEDSDLPYKIDLVNKEDLASSYLINAMKDRAPLD